MKLPLTIPAYNEEGSIVGSKEQPIQALSVETNETLVVNSASTRRAEAMLQDLQLLHLALRRVNDLVRCSLKLQEGYKCFFGSRIIESSRLPECTPHSLTEDW